MREDTVNSEATYLKLTLKTSRTVGILSILLEAQKTEGKNET